MLYWCGSMATDSDSDDGPPSLVRSGDESDGPPGLKDSSESGSEHDLDEGLFSRLGLSNDDPLDALLASLGFAAEFAPAARHVPGFLNSFNTGSVQKRKGGDTPSSAPKPIQPSDHRGGGAGDAQAAALARQQEERIAQLEAELQVARAESDSLRRRVAAAEEAREEAETMLKKTQAANQATDSLLRDLEREENQRSRQAKTAAIKRAKEPQVERGSVAHSVEGVVSEVASSGVRIAARDYHQSQDEWGCLTVCEGDKMLPLLESLGRVWIYMQAVDRPAELGWVPAFIFDTDPECEPPEAAFEPPPVKHLEECRLAANRRQSPEMQQVCESLRRMLLAEARASEAEARARDSELCAAGLEEERRHLEAHHRKQLEELGVPQLQRRAQEAERRAQDALKSLAVIKSNKGADTDKLKQTLDALTAAQNQKNDIARKCKEYDPLIASLTARDKILSSIYPALHKVVRWVEQGGLDKLTPGKLEKIPVLALRWAHDHIASNACFYDGRSVFYALNELIRGQRLPDHWSKENGRPDPPDVILFEGRLHVATANRRLTVLSMFQALNRSDMMSVSCNIRSIDEPRWRDKLLGNSNGWQPALTTKSNGLDMKFGGRRNAVALHCGFNLFDIQDSAFKVFKTLLQGDPRQDILLGAVECRLARRTSLADEYELVRKFDGRSLWQVMNRA